MPARATRQQSTALRCGFAALLACLTAVASHAADPTAEQQYWLELINRMRLNPADELDKLVNFSAPGVWAPLKSNDPDVADARSMLDGDEEVKTVTGLEFWFHPGPGQKPARRYKQALVTLSVIFPLTLFVPRGVQWLAGWVPALHDTYLSHFATSAIVVALMTYVLMPRITRRVAGWLYR